jgi:uncharacterized protein
MKIFLDTSTLFKLYHQEAETSLIEELFSKFEIEGVYISEITKIEFESTIWKKVRMKEITSKIAKQTLDLFENDCNKYLIIGMNSFVIEIAKFLLNKYGLKGLRTLDSIQFASAITVKSEVELFLTSDDLLQSFFKSEGMTVSLS